jgi:hypothetical protein
MATLFQTGFESGDFTDAQASFSGATIVTTPVRSGTYALAVEAQNSNGARYNFTDSAAESWATFYLNITRSGTPGSTQSHPVFRFLTGSNGVIAGLVCRNNSSGVSELLLTTGATLTGSAHTITSWINAGYFKVTLYLNTTTGVMRLFVDDVQQLENTGQTFTAAPSRIVFATSGTVSTVSCVHQFDDVVVEDASPVSTPPTYLGGLTTQTYPAGAVITPYDAGAFFTGSDLVFSAHGLPAGLSIDPATGIISGTPSAT